MRMNKSDQKGQIALVVVLILVVVGAIVLSLVSRSITNIRLASIEESSTQALKAAEGGVEEALRNLTVGSAIEGILNDVSFEATTNVEGSDGLVTNDAVGQGEIVEILLDGAPTPPTSIDVYWGDATNQSETPVGAIEVIKYQRWSATDYRVAHLAFDTDGTRAASNNFAAGTANPGSFKGTTFAAKANIPIVAQDVLLRIRVFYRQAKIGVAPLPGGSSLPDQLYRVVSTGTTGEGIIRRVEAERTLPVLPPQFDAAVYSGGALSQ